MKKILLVLMLLLLTTSFVYAEETEHAFPLQDSVYDDQEMESIFDILAHRIKMEPFNLAATIIFLLAIIHTMCKIGVG